VLLEMVNRRLVEGALDAAGLTLDTAQTDEEIMKLQERFPTPDAFANWLSQQGLTLEELRSEIAFGQKLEKLCTKDVTGYTEADLDKFFQDYKARYDKPLRVTISEIVLTTKEEADKVYELATQEGASFADLARQHSVSSIFRDAGGRRPEAPLAALMPPELKAPASTLEVGTVSKPLKVGEGELAQWYIIKVEDRKPPEEATLETARKDVERDYKRLKAKQPAELLSELRQTAQVSIYAPEFQDLNELFRPQQELPSFGGQGPQGGGTAGGGPRAPAQGPPPAAPADTQ